MAEIFPLNRISEIQERPQDFKLLERIPLNRRLLDKALPLKLAEPLEGERVHTVVFLDTETTGFYPDSDKIIELALVRCSYSIDRRMLLSIDRCYDGFEDPKRPLPEKIVELTHITDQMVSGQSFDEDKIAQLLVGRPLIVAHNASFDRPFFDERFKTLSSLSWADSLGGVDWDSLGFGNGKKLEYLTTSRGWFYEAHRAVDDCFALAWLFKIEPRAFALLIESAVKKDYAVYAWGCPFSQKEAVKSLGYSFDGSRRVWYKNFRTEQEAKRQITVLSQYYDASTTEIKVYTAATRFKEGRRGGSKA